MTSADHESSPCQVREYRHADYDSLVDMYDRFKPKGMFQGMPPRDKKIREEWISMLIESGNNFLAWHEGRVIGHVAILPKIEKSDAEYLIFVDQDSRGKGVGRDLTRAALKKAGDLKISTVWLTVDAYNFRGIKLYRRYGFEFKEEHGSASERTMVLKMQEIGVRS